MKNNSIAIFMGAVFALMIGIFTVPCGAQAVDPAAPTFTLNSVRFNVVDESETQFGNIGFINFTFTVFSPQRDLYFERQWFTESEATPTFEKNYGLSTWEAVPGYARLNSLVSFMFEIGNDKHYNQATDTYDVLAGESVQLNLVMIVTTPLTDFARIKVTGIGYGESPTQINKYITGDVFKDFDTGSFLLHGTPVPEPSSVLLGGLTVISITLSMRRRRLV